MERLQDRERELQTKMALLQIRFAEKPIEWAYSPVHPNKEYKDVIRKKSPQDFQMTSAEKAAKMRSEKNNLFKSMFIMSSK